MRPTATRLDGMPGAKSFSPWWGDTSIHKQRGVVVYTVSPFRQRGSKAVIRGWLFNGYRRLAAQVPYWIVPFAIGYGTYTWGNSRYAWQNSKAGHIALGDHHH
ncbi:cytochrome b-c1 complex subunit 8 [Suillus plorans]|uniref:Cytochrome b-c1 complex subunit 8 n=1 Tax=Suillus plorans TaxID=116603 RepID=A0A9P7DSQ8_9AGAM|nr:cytochrome b-c1 complex subunit 8 [Suillus plorans]KAG1802071.1 cytochrome b-c1 complex subunit 8 [Suillus plorans]